MASALIRSILASVALVVLASLVVGCTAPAETGPVTTITPVVTVSVPATTVTLVPTASPNSAQFAGAKMLNVLSVAKNWDADADTDGIAIYPALVNEDNVMISWQGEVLPVDIEIYTTRMDENQGYKFVKDKVVYTGRGYLTHWEQAQMLYGKGKGIPVAFEEMSVPNGVRYGETLATVHLPDGRTFAGKGLATPLTP